MSAKRRVALKPQEPHQSNDKSDLVTLYCGRQVDVRHRRQLSVEAADRGRLRGRRSSSSFSSSVPPLALLPLLLDPPGLGVAPHVGATVRGRDVQHGNALERGAARQVQRDAVALRKEKRRLLRGEQSCQIVFF